MCWSFRCLEHRSTILELSSNCSSLCTLSVGSIENSSACNNRFQSRCFDLVCDSEEESTGIIHVSRTQPIQSTISMMKVVIQMKWLAMVRLFATQSFTDHYVLSINEQHWTASTRSVTYWRNDLRTREKTHSIPACWNSMSTRSFERRREQLVDNSSLTTLTGKWSIRFFRKACVSFS
jgi:hypothetical protein